jgi:hypothetical protein
MGLKLNRTSIASALQHAGGKSIVLNVRAGLISTGALAAVLLSSSHVERATPDRCQAR